LFQENLIPDKEFIEARQPQAEPCKGSRVSLPMELTMEAVMSFGKGALLWLIGIPLPIILLLAVFMHH
jgi:hypothetical protein